MNPLELVVLLVISSFYLSLSLSTEFLLEFCVVIALPFFYVVASLTVTTVLPVTEVEPPLECPLVLSFEVTGEASLVD